MFRVRCEVCGRSVSVTNAGVVCVHSGRDNPRCQGTGLVVPVSGELLPCSASTGHRDDDYWDVTMTRGPGPGTPTAAETRPRYEGLLAEAHAELRYAWTVRARPPVDDWEQSGSSVRTVGGGLPSLGRRR